jgi:glucose-1-phosphate adenylyltransferase
MTVPTSPRPDPDSALAVILGGGRGTRLWPLTKYRAKPAVPIAGKYRLIDIPISICINSGIEQIYVLTQYNSSSLNRHISETYQVGPFSRGFVHLEAAAQQDDTEDWYQGTADAVRRNIKSINQWRTEHIVILPGDTMFRMDLRDMLRAHVARNADVTIALHPTEARRAAGFGILTIDDDDRVLTMVEKPKNPETLEPLQCSEKIRTKWNMPADRPYLASMGIYIFRRTVLNEMLEDRSITDFGHDLLPRAVGERHVGAYVFTDFWEDIGTIESFFTINLMLARPTTPFVFYYPGAPIYTRRRFLPATRIQKVAVEKSVLSEGCRIQDAQLENCMIGLRSVIGKGVRMRDTVMMGADYYEDGVIHARYEDVPADAPLMGVGDDCVIERTIIDKNARIGAGCRIANAEGRAQYDDPRERFYIREGIVIIPKHATLEPGTIV